MAETPTVIVGGGLTGLTIAYRLVQAGRRVIVIERDARLGGQIHSTQVLDEAGRGLVVELGAEGFVARSEAVPALCRDLGIEASLIDQVTTLTFVAGPKGLTPLAPGEAAKRLGFQVPKDELGRGVRTIDRGMGKLIDALANALAGHAEVRRSVGVQSIARDADQLRLSLTDGACLQADRVVMTCPAFEAASMLAPLCEQASGLTNGQWASSINITAIFPRAAVADPLAGSGFITTEPERLHGFRACSFVTTKFARGASEDVMLRGFFRPSDEDRDLVSDDAWQKRMLAVIRPVLGITADPKAMFVSKWTQALPVYSGEFRAAVAAAETALKPLGVRLAGSHFHGAGIDAAIRSADLTASALLAG